MMISRGLQSRARSHGWRVGRSFGAAACHPHRLHPRACQEMMLPWESAEIALGEALHSAPPPPAFLAQLASWSPHPSLAQKPEGEGPETWAALLRLNQYEHSDIGPLSLYKSSDFNVTNFNHKYPVPACMCVVDMHRSFNCSEDSVNRELPNPTSPQGVLPTGLFSQ